ncbi:hypothetical protein [Chamaesiphon polymorphus]|nr:hypothetical protein [Chamaesiphon polymorphus]
MKRNNFAVKTENHTLNPATPIIAARDLQAALAKAFHDISL